MSERITVIGLSVFLFGGLGFGMGLYVAFVATATGGRDWLYPAAVLAFAGLGAGIGAALGTGQDAPFAWSLGTAGAGALVGLVAGLAGANLTVTIALAVSLAAVVAITAART